MLELSSTTYTETVASYHNNLHILFFRRAAEEEKKRVMRKKRVAAATSELELLKSIPAKDLPKLDLVKKIAGIGTINISVKTKRDFFSISSIDILYWVPTPTNQFVSYVHYCTATRCLQRWWRLKRRRRRVDKTKIYHKHCALQVRDIPGLRSLPERYTVPILCAREQVTRSVPQHGDFTAENLQVEQLNWNWTAHVSNLWWEYLHPAHNQRMASRLSEKRRNEDEKRHLTKMV